MAVCIRVRRPPCKRRLACPMRLIRIITVLLISRRPRRQPWIHMPPHQRYSHHRWKFVKLSYFTLFWRVFIFSFQMSPLNNNTLSSSSLQHHQQPQHHSHHHNNPQQQHEMNVTSSSSPSSSSFNTSVAKGSPPMVSVASTNECLASAPPGSSPSSLTTSSSSMSSVAAVSAVSADWTAALQRSAASQQMTTAFAGHGFPGMYGWY